jgi:hypothetical protein
VALPNPFGPILLRVQLLSHENTLAKFLSPYHTKYLLSLHRFVLYHFLSIDVWSALWFTNPVTGEKSFGIGVGIGIGHECCPAQWIHIGAFFAPCWWIYGSPFSAPVRRKNTHV